MTWIRIDPDEMTATATALQSVAGEISTIGGEVQSQCGSCCVPVDVEAQVLGSVSAIDAGLGSLSSDLAAWANDLANRGALAASGSLPTAASSASGAGSSADGFGGLTTDWLSGMDAPTTATIGGGDGFGGLTIDWLSGMDAPTTATIGGGLTSGWMSGMDAPTTATIGGGSMAFAGWGAPTFATIGGSTGSAGFFAGNPSFSSILDANAHLNDIWANPSRSELMSGGGGYQYMSPAEYIDRGYHGLNE